MEQIHSLLKRQLKKHFVRLDLLPKEWQKFLEMVNDAYHQFDDDRNMIAHALDLSSQELLQANSEMRAMFQTFPDILFRLDTKGTILDCKSGTKRDLYIFPKKLTGKRIQDIPVKDIGIMFQEAIRQIVKDGKPIVSIEYQLPLQEGRRFYEARLAPLLGDQIIAIIRDITVSMEAKEALRESEERYRVVLETSPDPIVAYDTKARVTYLNPAFTKVFGWTLEELLGKKMGYIPENKKIEILNIVDKIKRGETFSGVETCCYNKEGMLVDVSISAAIWRDNYGEPHRVVLVLRDITRRRNMEEQLRQSQKMEAIGTLAGGIAHDFNNLLTVIMGNAELALMHVIKDKSLRKEIEEIKNAGERAASLTQQLLAFSRKQVIKLEVLNLNKVVNETKKMLKRIITEDIELITVLEPELWKIRADSGQINQVIMNLVVNAKDAMSNCADSETGRPQGGKLTVETANADLDMNYFREHAITGMPGPYVMLAISDTGIGIDKKTLEHIFEPFFTTKDVGKGTGLGLSTVYGIVKQNNGFVWVYSEPGKGTTFKVYLPKMEGDVEAKEKEQTCVKNLGSSETVLIVEDHEDLRKFSQSVLQMYGYKILEAENGEDALRICEEYEGQIDLMVTDMVMPKMGGKEAADKMQSLYPQIKVLYMSGYTDQAIIHHGVLEPGLNFLEKPFTPEDLARKVRQVLNQSSQS
ncbi:MAG: PAS domain S-box protein [Candidatus Desulfaltia sp.]|nr:PAS domain S-box protein [Candidatus Desulfaltia sp.]